MKATKFLFTILLCATASCLMSTISFAQVIAAGWYHSLAVCNDSTVRGWGLNYFGNLGDNTATDKWTPVQVSGLIAVTALAGGGHHTLVIKNNGTVWAWGRNVEGALGDGTTTNKWAPVQVHGTGNVGFLTAVTALAGGNFHSLALKNDSTVWAWGDNSYGKLGDGTTTNRTTPVQVGGLTGITAIAGASQHSIALKNNGTVWTWGWNGKGALGDNTTTDRWTPVQVSGLTGISAIAIAEDLSLHSMALKNDSTVWAWGHNLYGQLGDGTTDTTGWCECKTTPVQVSGLTGITAIVAGSSHSLALKNDSTVWAWGYNFMGQLGVGDTTDKHTPVQVNGLTGIIAIAAGAHHSLALKNDSTVWAWGYNSSGQLGDGTTNNSNVPVQVSGLCQMATAVSKITEQSFISVYPNPSNGKIEVRSEKLEGRSIEIHNVLGETVFQTTLHSSPSTLHLNVPAGIYYYRVNDASGTVEAGKLVIK